MRILAVSDSHGYSDTMLKAVARESPDLILHLGDHDKDCAAIEAKFPEIPLRSVRGNCDLTSTGLIRDQFTLGGKCFFMTHGHHYGVKTGFNDVIEAAASNGADILLFGHTHTPHYSVQRNMTIINPGSISIGKGETYAVLELEDGTVECEIKKAREQLP